MRTQHELSNGGECLRGLSTVETPLLDKESPGLREATMTRRPSGAGAPLHLRIVPGLTFPESWGGGGGGPAATGRGDPLPPVCSGTRPQNSYPARGRCTTRLLNQVQVPAFEKRKTWDSCVDDVTT